MHKSFKAFQKYWFRGILVAKKPKTAEDKKKKQAYYSKKEKKAKEVKK